MATATVTGNTVQQNGYAVYQGGRQPTYSSNTIPQDSTNRNTYDVIGVGGTLSGTVQWNNIQSYSLAYLVYNDLTVTGSLTIPAATAVKLGQYNSMTVNGALVTQGTAGHEVLFTSYLDDAADAGGDSNGDGGATIAHAGDWETLTLGSSNANLSYCKVRYGGSLGV